MDKYIGRLLDNRYEILEVIGTGGMAVVYKARCHRLNRFVAIKILKDDYLEDEDFRARFHAESQAVAMLSHPNIVAVYDVSSSIMADYIVMELIDGITLKQYMEKKGVLNWKETLHFAIQIAKALEHAHSRGIVHRDIKPHNIMVLKNGSVKVADFGIARMMSEGNTLTKEALGSVHYISPEQARGGRVDNRSDIYSLGVVMYEMMAGRPPFDGDSPVSVAIAHINGGAPLPSTYNPNIPGGLEQIIMKAMAHDVNDRYPNASKMLEDMEEFRKDPTILFDYNVPPTDAVIKLQPQSPQEYHPQTTAQRVAQKDSGVRRPPQPVPPKPRRPANPPAPKNREVSRPRRDMDEEQKRNRVAMAAIITCSVVAIVAVVIFLVTFLNGGIGSGKETLVKVPDLLGKVYTELPEYQEFVISKEEVYDEEHEEGTIIDQEPKAGVEVVEGTRLVLKVSLGPTPRDVRMHELEGFTEDQALSWLNSLEMNLDIETRREFHDDIPENSVIRTEPGKDTKLTAGQKIVLFVSKGKEIKTSSMPNLLEEEKDRAIGILEKQDLDLQVTVEEVFDSRIAEGNVVKTEPAKGAELQTGQSVKLYVSKGPQKEKVPDVEGLDIDKAVNILISAGFKTPTIQRVESDRQKDTVISQSVEKNTMADINTDIILEVSEGKKQPKPVTKDMEIDLQGLADVMERKVTVTLRGNKVFEETVSAGTQSIVVKKQTGTGKVDYTVTVDGGTQWVHTEEFTANG